jgi:hypothetical protein
VALIGRLSIPAHRRHVIPGGTLAVVVHQPKNKLCHLETPVGNRTPQPHRDCKVADLYSVRPILEWPLRQQERQRPETEQRLQSSPGVDLSRPPPPPSRSNLRRRAFAVYRTSRADRWHRQASSSRAVRLPAPHIRPTHWLRGMYLTLATLRPHRSLAQGGYWARQPLVDQWGNVVSYSPPRFFCP